MIEQAQLLTFLSARILDPGTQWSLGTFGGIAEFSRDPDEAVDLATSANRISAITDRGAVTIEWQEDLRPVASESLARIGWSHRVSLCLPVTAAAMNRRGVLTELGADAGALREQDRASVLFDIGLDALQADLCIRTSDPEVIAQLRDCAGRSVFEPGNPAMGVVLAAQPHRVFVSRIGRLEVYQPIPPASGKSPDGPHTHVLPKLLRSQRTHPATEPVPDGFVPCAHFYPAHPGKDAMGAPRPFDRRQHDAFQLLMATYGLPEAVALKARVTRAVADNQPPSASDMASDRFGRASIRVALRQMQALRVSSPALSIWLEAFDRVDQGSDDDDDAARQHGH
jgi:hypothetical protein